MKKYAYLFVALALIFAKALCAAPSSNRAKAKNDEAGGKKSVVYFSSEITSQSLVKVFDAVGWAASGKVAIKMSTGEPPASNYLRPELVKDLVQKLGGTIVECNTAYGGRRSKAVDHKKVAEEHGFTKIAAFDLLDEAGEVALPVNGQVLKNDYVGAKIADYNSCLVLSHFKGHAMAGFGGAIKNASIGFASSKGKLWIHTGGHSKTSWGGGTQEGFCDAMADAAMAVSNYFGGGERIVFVNVLNRLSIDCDCNGRPAEPDIHDIGVAASRDPVALDKACLDLTLAAKGSESFRARVRSKGGERTLVSAQKIGLGSLSYTLVSVE